MRRPRFGSVLATVAIAIAGLIPMFAAPAGAAAASCSAGEFPATFAAQSGLKVACNSDALDNVGGIVIHDATNVDWHHGAARTFTMVGSLAGSTIVDISSGPTTLNFVGGPGQITVADVGRPISAYNPNAVPPVSVFPGGLFIKSVTGATAQVSQAFTGNVTGPITVTIEHTRNRLLVDALCHSIAPGNAVAKYVSAPNPGFLTADPLSTYPTSTYASIVQSFHMYVGAGQALNIPSAGSILVPASDSSDGIAHTIFYNGHPFPYRVDNIGVTGDPAGLAVNGPLGHANEMHWASSSVDQINNDGHLSVADATPKLPDVNAPNVAFFTVTTTNPDTTPGTDAKFSYQTHTNAGTSSATINSIVRQTASSSALVTPSSIVTWTTAQLAHVTGNLNVQPGNTTSGNEPAAAFTGGTADIETSTAANYTAGATNGTFSWGSTSGNAFNNIDPNLTTESPATATIKQGYRVHTDLSQGATYSTVLTSASAGFTSADLGKSVTGGPFGPGVYIASLVVSAPTTQVNLATQDGSHPIITDCTKNDSGNPNSALPIQPVSANSLEGDTVEIGAATYNTTGVHEPQLFPRKDPISIELSNNTAVTGGTAFTCTGSTLTLTAAAFANFGGFTAGDVGLPVGISSITASPAGTIQTTAADRVLSVNLVGSTAITMSEACPGSVIPAPQAIASAFIGGPSASGPASGDAVMSLAAELNLSPALVPTQDDCQPGGNASLATFEGFEVIGSWTPPGANYTANAAAPITTVAQVLFPTSVLSFNGFVVPRAGGDTVNPQPHYNFEFPVLPTSVAVCLNNSVVFGGVPTDPTQIALGMNAATLQKAPFLPTGSGNAGDPIVRRLLPVTSAFAAANSGFFGSDFHQNIELKTPGGLEVGASPFDGAPCTIGAPTVLPAITTCGTG